VFISVNVTSAEKQDLIGQHTGLTDHS